MKIIFLKILFVLSLLAGTIEQTTFFSGKTFAENPIPTPKFYHPIPPAYYMGCITKKIRSYWHEPPNYAGEKLIVSFRIYPDGRVSNFTCSTVYDPTGLYRNSVFLAVRGALPLPAPPKEIIDPVKHYVSVNIDFRAVHRFKDNPIPVKTWFKDPNKYQN